MSYAQFKRDELGPGGGPLLKLLHMLRLVALETGVGEKKDEIRVNNLTLINFVIKFVGPQREDRLTAILLAIQVCVSSSVSHCLCSCQLHLSSPSFNMQVFFTLVAFSIRYGFVRFFYDVVQ